MARDQSKRPAPHPCGLPAELVAQASRPVHRRFTRTEEALLLLARLPLPRLDGRGVLSVPEWCAGSRTWHLVEVSR